jgi:hypothetical protein
MILNLVVAMDAVLKWPGPHRIVAVIFHWELPGGAAVGVKYAVHRYGHTEADASIIAGIERALSEPPMGDWVQFAKVVASVGEEHR